MKLLQEMIHPELTTREGRVLRRHAARGIVLREDRILLLFTERYNDFSLPGGGIDEGEDMTAALQRELEEETGAREVVVKEHFGFIEEYRPHWKPEYDLMHMTSHFFVCDVAQELADARMESYEVANGMRPLWMPIAEAISHNRQVMARQEKTMGQSIQRETFMLDKIDRELVVQNVKEAG
ncbi:MAG: NUDIX domain-containing protein [Natronospirillum sp.]|uniref:NUDIX domain-containing protein n=1 Tax=Natronospirillum sp. TaxID=2812955 RepID=UPI0025EC78F2|nr:NUDIX domain-containing protein [Natronospirillum sp.]MCH8553322.1 NUDIX domain-containing protein [Natronospirillum sp.]